MTHLTAELAYVTTVARRSPALERDQEVELARRFRASGDRRAADTLVRAHLRMVIALAIRYRHYGVALTELVAEGNCGLVAALQRFDPERGIRFGTYAKYWVRAHILTCAVRSLNLVGPKTGLVKPRVIFKLRRERARIAAVLGEGAAAEEALAQCMNVSLETLRQMLSCLDARSVSLDNPADDSAEHVRDTLASDDNPEERYAEGCRRNVESSAVSSALTRLDRRERFIAEHRIMAAATDELSLAEIAKVWGISRERVRQLEERAKRKLCRSSAIQDNSALSEWRTDG
jgi:RNA polymerase sigma-32 factor